ncbi:hypothetical protein LTR53_003230 [Teratosphaeriaceae sp. CCFEE 6253]|nr:hypothetical protein LTR53_003230 [Teratosphaeriaceae sp. CCFEE 6253]
MSRTLLSALAAALLASDVLAERLFASHYTGKIYTLSYERSSSSTGTLSNEASTAGCGKMPAWLTLDRSSRTLYCFDESYGSGVVKTSGADVHGWLYGGPQGEGFLAMAE